MITKTKSGLFVEKALKEDLTITVSFRYRVRITPDPGHRRALLTDVKDEINRFHIVDVVSAGENGTYAIERDDPKVLPRMKVQKRRR